jgi:hypothetical protein
MTDHIERATAANISAFLADNDRDLRRQWNRKLNSVLCAASEPYQAEMLSQSEMLDRCVFVEGKDEVVVLPPPFAEAMGKRLRCYPKQHFKSINAGNLLEHPTRRNRAGDPVQVNAADIWFSDTTKRVVDDNVMAIGEPRFTTTPSGDVAVNLWTPNKREKAEGDIALFLGHVEYLVPIHEDRERFLDWLAHCEQKPEELPHHGWLMWTERYGIGRNWLANLLVRVWRGEVAPSLDLGSLLESQFNHALSCKRLVIVDEINLSGHTQLHKLAARQRQLMTEEVRVINPKYGKTYAEKNSNRWLVFSNHQDAIPIPADDRRFEVVQNPDTPRPESDYNALYKALNDNDFVASVAWFLSTRDISRFNPGRRPPMTAAKLALIEATTPQMDKDARDVLAEWSAAGIKLFCSSDLIKACGANEKQTAAFSHVLRRLKVVPVGGQRRVHGRKERLFAVTRAAWEDLVGPECVGGAYEAALARILLERGDGGHFYVDERTAGGF